MSQSQEKSYRKCETSDNAAKSPFLIFLISRLHESMILFVNSFNFYTV